MLEKPNIADEAIINCLRENYGLNISQVAFLPLGADRNTAVYRADADDAAYFVKLRQGMFDEMTVAIPKLLHEQGVEQIIPPLSTRTGALWADLGDFAVMLSPFVVGLNAYELSMTEAHWFTLGRTLRELHTITLPLSLTESLPRESYSAYWRDLVRDFQAQVETASFNEPVAATMAAFLRDKRNVVSELVGRAERLAGATAVASRPFVLCHADIHAGNVLIEQSGVLWVVDWDTLILAPKERDLMFPGGGLFAGRRKPEDEETLFYRGYGQTQIDPVALAYYRYERIVQDIAAYCEQLLLTEEGGADRAVGLEQFTSQFEPGEVIDIAFQSDKTLPSL